MRASLRLKPMATPAGMVHSEAITSAADHAKKGRARGEERGAQFGAGYVLQRKRGVEEREAGETAASNTPAMGISHAGGCARASFSGCGLSA